MMRRLLVAVLFASGLAATVPASAAPIATGGSADTVRKVVRQYGDGPVALRKGEIMQLRFKGKRGDRVQLGVVYRAASAKPYYGLTSDGNASVHGRDGDLKPDAAGFFRLPADGWFRIDYRAEVYVGKFDHVQLLKQVRVAHDERRTTRLPQRRGYQYAVRVRAPRSGLQVVSFGTRMFGVLSKGRYGYNVDGESLVLSPGRPVFDAQDALSKKLAPRQQVVVMVDPSSSGRVTTIEPTEVGRMLLDGPAVALPGGGDDAVVAEVATRDLAASAQRLLNVRIPGAKQRGDWNVIALPESGGVAEPSAPAYSLSGPMTSPIFQVPDNAGTWRILAFPGTADAVDATFELDSVADGGPIAVDAAPVSVPLRADGRYTLLTIAEPRTMVYLTVPAETVDGYWAVYAGNLAVPTCGPRDALGCGESNGASVGSGSPNNNSFNGGHVLVMPGADQTAGDISVSLLTEYPR